MNIWMTAFDRERCGHRFLSTTKYRRLSKEQSADAKTHTTQESSGMASRKSSLHQVVTRPISSENCTIDVIRDVLAWFSAENLPVVRGLSQAGPQEQQNLEDAVALMYRLCEVIRALDAKEWRPVAVEMILEALGDIYRWIAVPDSVVLALAWPEAAGFGLALVGFGFPKCQARPACCFDLWLWPGFGFCLQDQIMTFELLTFWTPWLWPGFGFQAKAPTTLVPEGGTPISDPDESRDSILTHIILCDSRIFKLSISSPRFLDLVIWTWTYGEPFQDLNNRFLLVRSVLNDENGLESLAQRFLTDPRKLKGFLSSTVWKARQANQAPTFEVGVSHIEHILEIVTLLSNSSANSDVWYTLLKLGYVQGMMHGLTSLAAKEYTPASTSMHWKLLDPIHSFVYTGIHPTSTLLIPPFENDHALYAKAVLEIFAAYLVHPCVLRISPSGGSNWDPFTGVRSGEQPSKTGYILYPDLKLGVEPLSRRQDREDSVDRARTHQSL
ncbi:hypothetical protein DFP72DRAFT_843047 [Ephemerocybe angulata]|uniref:Uncharacterized protein n=1 Tax=Ephemerocybe angulata TaxID=980116 RepID=A0A8H6MA66_9AGAR|nr:hypothetical protein DFP72DRAFT_843047 [Tulosesus angulatus]